MEGLLSRLCAWLWSKKWYTGAIIVAGALAIVLAVSNVDTIRSSIGPGALWVATKMGYAPAREQDPAIKINNQIREVQERLQGRTTPQERELYSQQLKALELERQKLLDELNKKLQASTKAQVHLTYSALEQRAPVPGKTSWRTVGLGENLFSVEWEFTAYVIRSKEAQELGNPILRETTTVSDVINLGRLFYLGGITLRKQPSGEMVPAGVSISSFRPAKSDWLTTKITLETNDVFVGTIFTGAAPNPAEQIWAMLGLGIELFPLSLEDPSFSSVPVKDLTEKYGLISMKSLLGLVFDPSLISKIQPPIFEASVIGGKKLSDYEMLALRAVGARHIEPLAATKP